MSRSVIPETDDASPSSKASSTPIPRKGLSIEEDPPKSTILERKMGTKLGWSLYSEKSLYRKSIDSIRNG